MHKCHWIDEGGRWHSARSPRLDLTGPGHYAFRYLGLVKVGGHYPRTLQWDIKRVRPDAMLAARKWLAEEVAMRPVSLVYYFGGWFVEHLNNGFYALDRIDRLNAYKDVVPPTQAYEKKVNYDDAVLARPIRMSYDLWRKDEGRLGDSDAPAMAALAQHLVVLGTSGKAKELRYRHIGHQSHLAQIYSPDQLRKLIGKRCGLEPEFEILRGSTTEAYKDVIESREPAFHHLCASAKPKNRPRRWFQLERGLFPFRLPEGSPALVAVCAPRRAVNIPFCP